MKVRPGSDFPLVLGYEYDFSGFPAGEEIVGRWRVVQTEAMGDQRTYPKSLAIQVDERVVIAIDEVPDSVGRDLLFQELLPRIDRCFMARPGEDEATLFPHRVERQIDPRVRSAR